MMNNTGQKVFLVNDFVLINNQLLPKTSISQLIEEIGDGENIENELSTLENTGCTWDDNTTKLFLDEYEKYIAEFRNPKIKKKIVWDKIAAHMKQYGHVTVTAGYLDQKLRNMKTTYKKIKDNNKKSTTGHGRVNWRYYDRFEQIFASDKTINMPPLVSTVRQVNLSEDKSSQPFEEKVESLNSSRNSTPMSEPERSETKNRLHLFRKRQLALEEMRLEEVKQIRLEVAESNRINREKLLLLQKYLEKKTTEM